ncbi:hypothetical protein NEF87_001308 [Candidatus Lokiarchaeum ossiferum]|uniref:Uncharacterized protein n=1 Tax=Candidatus Lokiarchaeum ossiferum TaxID=2951803 RepID=A0ABY6HND1_9ARCH|nr:hypothetical protein NEF87_001308 [Candidatus Lokiarchaeum sp. B-35]
MPPIISSRSQEIILIFHIESTETKNFPKKAIVMLMQDVTAQMGVSLNLDLKTHSLIIKCKNIDSFKIFFEMACIKIPLSSIPSEKPFEIQFTFNAIPPTIHEVELIDFLEERFQVMNIGLNPIIGTGIYKIIFPCQEMYKIAVIGMLERMHQLSIP